MAHDVARGICCSTGQPPPLSGHICEAGFGKEVAARILSNPHLIVAAFAAEELIGLARATFDGLSAHVMEFLLDLRWQGPTAHANGSLLEHDPHGVARQMADRLLA